MLQSIDLSYRIGCSFSCNVIHDLQDYCMFYVVGNLEWLDKNKTRFLIMWRRPDEWGKVLYQWVSKNGTTNSVFTLYELINGDDTVGEEFHGLDEAMLLRSLEALQMEHKAEIITLNDSKGVKFF
ncbi:hypothetical protein GDO78_020321 [Eleutherodactylus coqui]|uniref:Vacuolar protein-sorting-associated protein 25 n=1 Tax=Eleutherodactylus coqui TaxID=57060 RepID=A0A8J6JPL4_ELECQ|nr:hypothetical protein GDO78_020321 [Eleutherodactylus coqui]